MPTSPEAPLIGRRVQPLGQLPHDGGFCWHIKGKFLLILSSFICWYSHVLRTHLHSFSKSRGHRATEVGSARLPKQNFVQSSFVDGVTRTKVNKTILLG